MTVEGQVQPWPECKDCRYYKDRRVDAVVFVQAHTRKLPLCAECWHVRSLLPRFAGLKPEPVGKGGRYA